MSIGLLLITHGYIGKEILNTAVQTLGYCPLEAAVYGVTEATTPEQAVIDCNQLLLELKNDSGTIIFTDAYGSTPSNIAMALAKQHDVALITGLNLPMMLRVMNYPGETLDKLITLAQEGGKDGILLAEGLIHPR